MVCPRCIDAVKDCLTFNQIDFNTIDLGKVMLAEGISSEKKDEIRNCLSKKGFELIDSEREAIVSKIKSLIISQIHYSKEPLAINYSDYLSDKTKLDYSYLSRLFSAETGSTIERFIAKQRIEKVKELLHNAELSTSEIAFQLGYSSVAYLSSQFKKETGMTISAFKNNGSIGRISLDKV